MTRYIVETEMLGGWENCWTDGEGEPLAFDTEQEAKEAIADHIADCREAVEAGDMQDAPEPDSLRIVGQA
jgi:hypothetical protein